MSSARKQLSASRCLRQTRAHRILALVPLPNACSDDGSDSEDDESTLLQPPVFSDSDISSDPPSISSSLERLNISEITPDVSDNNSLNEGLTSETHTNYLDDAPLTPIFNQVLPSSSTVNYDVLPTWNSVQSIPAPEAPEYSPHPGPSKIVTRATRTRTTRKRKQPVPPKVVPPKKAKKTKFTLDLNWSKAAFKHTSDIDEGIYEPRKKELDSILEYLYLFLSPDIILDIVHNTNLYSVQKCGKSILLSENEFKTFLGIEVLMGIVQMPAYTDYWAKTTRYPLIADQMPLKRYQQIRRYLHFVDNSFETTDRYFRIRPIMEKIRQNFLKIDEEGKYSIDEMMIPYKGFKAGNRRQYVKNKPKKWGFKNFVRAGVTGFIYDFIMYGGDDTFRGYNFTDAENSTGLGAKVVIALCKSIQKKPAVIYADNFFTCPELVYILRQEYGIFSLGTIKGNRLRGAQHLLTSDKVMKKKTRGYSDQVVCNDNKVAVVKWHDSKTVTMISSFVDSHPIGTIKRYSKDTKSKVDIPCPRVIKEYNKHMGGVDLADMLISLYRTPFKTRKWYMGIFAQLLDMCINNAWILYRGGDKNKLPLKNFRLSISEGLCKSGKAVIDENGKTMPEDKKIQKAVLERPTDSVRYDNVAHFPESAENRMRCKFCKGGKTFVYCIKCKMPLCFMAGGKNNRNRFRLFHEK